MEEEIQINIGKTYLTDVINNLQQSIALKIFRIDEEIDLELIADGIFQMLPELESEIILEVEKILIIEKSDIINYQFDDLRIVNLYRT